LRRDVAGDAPSLIHGTIFRDAMPPILPSPTVVGLVNASASAVCCLVNRWITKRLVPLDHLREVAVVLHGGHHQRRVEWRLHHPGDARALQLKLGLGKTDLVFTSRAAGLKTKFHALRHLHITYLLRSDVPVHVVSARAGHSRASITLDAYSHLLGDEDELAAK
jgi:hypothetical protein